ncbi:RNA-guided endonuclease InsQ/TnpB family protein [Priestia megaterium]|uniref:RNA-guided endonuclease InsQ/TnpB family protein n=1 Tax=Priestia megaterium TaxID=1404 RepID=UPI003CC5F851
METIYKTMTVPVKCSRSDYEYLSNCNKLSAQVWNRIIELEKEFRNNNDGKWIGRSKLQKELKGFVHLHAKGIQHIIGKYLYARDGSLASKKAGQSNVRLPYRNKNYFATGWTYQDIKIVENKILFTKPVTKEKINGKVRRQKPVVCHVKFVPDNIVQIELIYRNKLYLSIKYKEQSEHLQIQSNNSASIDLGEIHSIASIDTCGNALIITGRKMRAIKQLRNKHQARLYRRLSKCVEGSKQYWKYRKAMQKLSVKYENQINDAIHKTSKLFLDYCLENGISTVYYGDLDSATRLTKKKRIANNYIRQKLTQWSFGAIVESLSNKLSRHGIKLIKVSERYSSQKCPSCKSLKKPRNRQYSCQCGYKQHRDIVGAINILNDNHEINLTHYVSKKYLRIG